MPSIPVKTHLVWVVMLFLCLGCIGEDYIDDFVEPTIRINNPITGLQISAMHSYMATYLNNIGQPEDANIMWSSSNESIVTINEQGLATAVAEGEVTIRVSVTVDGNSITDEDTITISSNEMENNEESNKSGTITSTSGYALEGSFTLEASGNNLILSIDDDYSATSSLPGLYLYLTNNPNSINGALEVGPVTVFQGAHSYIIKNAGINDYQYLLYWCKPFSVKVGVGQIN
ncbi:Ig-like domain-containing protein [Flagellimonas lutimaris]|uniref:Ig-like domain-containing protein n=1 Tax=Flagellimonas lutimaris TaxID=475082 RepID=UPI003F5CEA2F